MAVSCLLLILLLFGGITAAPLVETDSEDEDVELLVVANAGLEGLHPRQVVEGDIMLDARTRHIVGLEEKKDSVLDRFTPGMKPSKKAAIYENLWPDGTIPYVFAAFFTEDKKKMVLDAMKEWEEKTCIKFVPRTSETDYITFTEEGSGCRSWVGKKGGSQKVYVGNMYCKKGEIMHELGHVIGFWHEHSRPDRDKYVEIKWGNINVDYRDNFKKYGHGEIDSLGVPYDYDSIMHYGKRTGGDPFGAITILPKTANVAIGQRKYLSFLDIKQANLLYKCKELPINIQNGYSGSCIQASQTTGEVYILLLADCDQNSLMQHWNWNEENQLYNPATLKCISTGPEGLLELRDCTSGDTLQQWLCANHYVEQPSTGNCITINEDSHQLVAERCAEEKSAAQKWNKFKVIIIFPGSNIPAPKSVEPVCTKPGHHTVTECYKEDIKLGWSVCNRLGYYVKGLSHPHILTITEYFNCCFTPHVFTGEPGTPSSVEEEICVNETWWFSPNTEEWFKCPEGYYLKGYFKEGERGWHAIQQVRCCKPAQGPSSYQHCQTESADGPKGLHQCRDPGYHIAGVYNTDCSLTDCVEQIYCCI